MIKNETRGTVAFSVGDETFSIEELVAMQLAHARRQAEKYGEEKVFGAVITVSIFNFRLMSDSTIRSRPISINSSDKPFSMLLNWLD